MNIFYHSRMNKTLAEVKFWKHTTDLSFRIESDVQELKNMKHDLHKDLSSGGYKE